MPQGQNLNKVEQWALAEGFKNGAPLADGSDEHSDAPDPSMSPGRLFDILERGQVLGREINEVAKILAQAELERAIAARLAAEGARDLRWGATTEEARKDAATAAQGSGAVAAQEERERLRDKAPAKRSRRQRGSQSDEKGRSNQ